MDDKNASRKLELETALLGLWDIDNKTYQYFFFPENLELIIGGLPIVEFEYEAFIKEEDNNPYLKITNNNHTSGNQQIKEYKILEIDTAKGLLRLISDVGAELNFHRNKQVF